MKKRLRLAEQSEIDWINSRYEEVNFVPSNFDKEFLAIAEVNGQKAGLGRLVKVNANTLELGGMYVFEPFRGQGIARSIVQFLLQHADSSQNIYCLPFSHLIPFYQECGFVLCQELKGVPKELLEKYGWCQENYDKPVSLMIYAKN